MARGFPSLQRWMSVEQVLYPSHRLWELESCRHSWTWRSRVQFQPNLSPWKARENGNHGRNAGDRHKQLSLGLKRYNIHSVWWVAVFTSSASKSTPRELKTGPSFSWLLNFLSSCRLTAGSVRSHFLLHHIQEVFGNCPGSVENTSATKKGKDKCQPSCIMHPAYCCLEGGSEAW